MEYDFNLHSYWLLLQRRKALILATALCLGIFTTLIAYYNRPAPIYESTATVKIEKSSTTTGIYLEAISWSDADYLETQTSIITSYPILEAVASELDLLPATTGSADRRTDPVVINTILALQEKLAATREGNSNLINITARDSKAAFSQQLANTLARVYTTLHTSEVNRRTLDARRFIESQLVQVRGRLEDAEEELRRFQEESQVISLDNQTNTFLQQLAEAETKKMGLEKQAAEISKTLALFKEAAKNKLTPDISFFIADGPPLYNDLNHKLVSLLMQRQHLLQTYTDDHPLVQDSMLQIQEIIDTMLATLTKQQSIVAQRLERVSASLTTLRQQLAGLPGKGLVLERLRRQVRLNEKIYSLLETKLQEARIMEAAKIEEVTIVKPALVPMSPINQTNIAAKGLAGGVLGTLLGLLAAIFVEALDTSIRSAEQVEKITDLPVLATISPYDSQEIARAGRAMAPDEPLSRRRVRRLAHLITHFLPESRVAENYREAMTALRFSSLDQQTRVVAFTSALANEGKTTAILNTAIALAQSHCRVLVIEADMRQPIIARWLGIDNVPGLTDLLLSAAEQQQAIRTVTDLVLGEMEVEEVTYTPGLDNLFILPCGTRPGNPSELLFSTRFSELLEEFAKRYDMVLVDLPPVLIGADTAIISSQVDGVVLVYRAGRTERQLLRRAMDYLRQAKAKTLGVIVNGMALKQAAIATSRYSPLPPPAANNRPLSSVAGAARRRVSARFRHRLAVWLVLLLTAGLLGAAYYWSYRNGGWL